MSAPPKWVPNIQKELAQARSARLAGNEGMARVCARRAAGIAIGVYLEDQGLPLPGPSAYDRLKYFGNLPGVTPQQAEICSQLTLRVNQEFNLPIDIDLIEQARILINDLLEINE